MTSSSSAASDSPSTAAENAQLREALRLLQLRYDALADASATRIQALEDENDALADANRLLELRAAPAAAVAVAPQQTRVPDELLLPGAGLAAPQELCSLSDTHAAGNLLSVATRGAVVLTGGADKCICAHDWRSRRKLCELLVSAPVLGIAFNPLPARADVFVAVLMDGRHGLFRLLRDRHAADDDDDGASEWRIEAVRMFHEHTRPGAMKLAWSADGECFATGASDKALHVFRCAHLATPAATTCEKLRSFYFNGTVEALAFVPPTGARSELLAVAVRDDCYVHYVDCSTFAKERVNMNQDGIEHVSYTIMDLRVSPSGKYLLAATDASRLFVFESNVVLRNFYGHKAGPYSQPRALWHPSEKYVLANTEEGGAVFVWCVASERVVETLAAHDALVRDFEIAAAPAAADGGQATLFTVSYDKLLKVWSASLVGSSAPASP
ncbi:hypothetical protein PybrP1_003167 [[Pythium] brassicae (nom. inval.)]|nr:hypothetical protein PybrP1_003167 [[Pythium] brassicae (nom. inval.)]